MKTKRSQSMQRKLIAFAAAAALVGNTAAASAQVQGRKVAFGPQGVKVVAQQSGDTVVVAPQVHVEELVAQQVEVDELFIAQGPAGVEPPPQAEIRGDNVIFLATEMSFAGK